jgi:peptide/nickel transport system substrate-binding protein
MKSLQLAASLLLLWTISRPAELAAQAAGRPVQAKTLTVCDDVQDPATLDPHKQFSEKNHTLLQQIYEGLVRFDADGKIEPGLAESWERQDPLRMRFKLRKGVRFHDGEPFDSKAVVFTISRYLAPETRFPAFGFINSIEKAEVVDEHTVDIITKYPDGLLLNRLAGFILIMAPDFIAKNGEQALQSRSAGTGPFILDRWEKGKAVVLKKNPDYWNPGYPKIDQLIFKFVPWDKQLAGLLSGDIDIITDLPGTQTTDVAANKTTKILKRETFYIMGVSFNVYSGPLSDIRVRKALNHAINKEDFIRFDVLGNGRILPSLTMPGEEGHNPTLVAYEYNPALARRLLKEAGYPNGLTLKLLVKEQGARSAKLIVKQLQAVGISVLTQMSTDADLLRNIASQHWDMSIAACPDPMAHSYFIQSIMLYSKSPFALGKHLEFDQKLEEMASSLNPAQREKNAQALDRLVHDDALSLFLYQRIKTYGINRRIVFDPPITGMPHFFGTAITDEKQ